jgi:hypothetical protein
MMRSTRGTRFGAWLGATFAAVTVLPAAELPGTGADEALAASLEVERTLIAEDLQRLARLAEERERIEQRLAALRVELESALHREGAGAAAVVEDLLAHLDRTEAERSERIDRERRLGEAVRDRLRRIELLEQQRIGLSERAITAGGVTGRWDVVLLPSGQRGRFFLHQSGTLVSGTYTLEGGWSGSLQGTFVNRKLLVERIDSRLGRAGQYEATISADGSRLRGSWTAYDLTGPGPTRGDWAADRYVPTEP